MCDCVEGKEEEAKKKINASVLIFISTSDELAV
jgi:hypothetical protein